MNTLPSRVAAAIEAVCDPELGNVTIAELGLLLGIATDDRGLTTVELVPTFLGCPALDLMARSITKAAENVGASRVLVRWRTDLPWTSERISQTGRDKLARLGIAVRADSSPEASVACPDCGHATVEERSEVGPTSCRAIGWCTTCRTPVEILRTATSRTLSARGC